MKNNTKTFLFIPLALSLLAGNACSRNNYVKAREVTSHIFETETYTSLDEEYANNYFKETYDNWSGGCSAITKKINVDGEEHRIVGRNMDLNVTDKCAYIVRTNIEGKNKTFGLNYTFRDISDNYDIVKNNGINEKFSKILPYMCDDVMNEHGLHVEINMRTGESWPNGDDKFACEGTNKDAANKVYMFQLTQLIALNCDTVQSAKNYVNSLNIYSQKNYWNYSFLVSDVNSSSLLELAMNKVHWTDDEPTIGTKIDYIETTSFDDTPTVSVVTVNALAQTNFYVNNDSNDGSWYSVQDIRSGIGRFDTLQQGITLVNSRADMFELMKKVNYSNSYDSNKWDNSFDPRSEFIGEIGSYTYDVLMNVTKTRFTEIIDSLFPNYASMTREEKIQDGSFWESTLCEVVDVNEKSIQCCFFENDNTMYKITLDSIEAINTIE